jgi:hypothetical protein
LAGQTHTTGRLRLAVEDDESNVTEVDLLDYLRTGRALEPVDPGHIDGRTAANCHQYSGPELGLVAVEDDADPLCGLRGVRTSHGADRRRVRHASL